MYSPWSNLKPPSFMTLVTGTTAPLEAIMVAVPTSKTCRMSGALPARNAAMAAVIDSSYWPLYVGTILYWVWLALYSLARSFTQSPRAALIECHHWISVWACAERSEERRVGQECR